MTDNPNWYRISDPWFCRLLVSMIHQRNQKSKNSWENCWVKSVVGDTPYYAWPLASAVSDSFCCTWQGVNARVIDARNVHVLGHQETAARQRCIGQAVCAALEPVRGAHCCYDSLGAWLS